MIIQLTRTDDGNVFVTPFAMLPEYVPADVDPTDAEEAFAAAVEYGTAELAEVPIGSVFAGSWWHEHFVTLHFDEAGIEAGRASDPA